MILWVFPPEAMPTPGSLPRSDEREREPLCESDIDSYRLGPGMAYLNNCLWRIQMHPGIYIEFHRNYAGSVLKITETIFGELVVYAGVLWISWSTYLVSSIVMTLGYKVFFGACLDEEVACQFSCDAVVCQLRRVALQAHFFAMVMT